MLGGGDGDAMEVRGFCEKFSQRQAELRMPNGKKDFDHTNGSQSTESRRGLFHPRGVGSRPCHSVTDSIVT